MEEPNIQAEIVWNCGDCAKDFATEKLIKAHVQKKHPKYLQKENQKVPGEKEPKNRKRRKRCK